jgi:hypothetical protein
MSILMLLVTVFMTNCHVSLQWKTGPLMSQASVIPQIAMNAAQAVSFLRHWEIFPSDGAAGLAANTPAHRLDEFPAGYACVRSVFLGWLRSRRADRRFTSRSPFCRQFISPYNEFSSNGNLWVNWLSQPRGPLYTAQRRPVI